MLLLNVLQMLLKYIEFKFLINDNDFTRSHEILVTLLDPRFSNLQFLTNNQRNLVHDNLNYVLDEFFKTESDIVISHDLDIHIEVKKIDNNLKLRKLIGNLNITEDVNPRATNYLDEFEQFLNIKAAIDVEITDWWCLNQSNYPKLAKFMRKSLVVQPTSSSSERIFALGGNIVKKNRTNLKQDFVRKLIFLKKNQEKL